MRAPSVASALSALCLLVAACAPSAAPPAPAAQYQVRGEILRLPEPPARDLVIRHEAIPSFRNENGKVVGMEAMTMPFTLAPEVAVEGLAVGDRIEFTLEVRWDDPSRFARVTRVARLPEGARLSWDS